MLRVTLQKEEEKSAKHALKTTGKHFWGVLQGQFDVLNYK